MSRSESERLDSLVARVIELTSTQSNSNDSTSGYTEFGNTSQPNSLSSSDDIDAIRLTISSIVIGKIREAYISPDCQLSEDDSLILEHFIQHHMMNMITCCNENWSKESKTITWLSNMIRELIRMLSSSFFLMSRTKHLILIPLLQVYDQFVQNIAPADRYAIRSKPVTSVLKSVIPSQEEADKEDEEKPSRLSCSQLDANEIRSEISTSLKQEVDESVSRLKDSMKDLLVLLFSFSVQPHEVQLFLDLQNKHHKRVLSASSSRNNSKNNTPVRSISGIVKQESSIDSNTDSCNRISEMLETAAAAAQDDYFILMSRALDPTGYMYRLPDSFFTLTSFSSLSLPPIKNFPIKGFTFATHIRLESVVLLQKAANTAVKDQRMFLFSFKTSSSPPIGFSAYFSFASSNGSNIPSNNGSTTGEPIPPETSSDASTTNTNNYLRLTISCFKGSLSPSLTHTLAFPFPLCSGDNQSSDRGKRDSEFIPLILTFSPTSLSLYLNGELMESSGNDWSISNMKSPIPSFDRCFIGCPFSSQSKVNISNPNDSGFTGQLASIYIFSASLTPAAVSLFASTRDACNRSPFFMLVPVDNVTSNPSSSSTTNGSNSVTLRIKEKEKYVKEINSNLVCLYSPQSVNWPIVLQNVNASPNVTSSNTASTVTGTSSSNAAATSHHHHHHHHSSGVNSANTCPPALTSHALIQGSLEVIQRNLLIHAVQSLGEGLDRIQDLMLAFIRERRFIEFSHLFSFALDLISSDVNHYFLESGVATGSFFRCILSALNSIDGSSIDRSLFLSQPSLFLPSLLSILQSMMSDNSSQRGTSSFCCSSSSPHPCHGIHVQSFMDAKELEIREIEREKVKRMRMDCVKQILDLFIFNSFLWSQLVPQDSEIHFTDQELMWKKREETLTSLFSFISTQLLSLPGSTFLLKRKRRAAFLIQVFYSLMSHFYHRKWIHMEKDQEVEEEGEGEARERSSDANSSPDSMQEEHEKRVKQRKSLFDRRERMISLIRSNILVFIKNLLTKTSSMNLVASGNSNSNSKRNSTSNSCKDSPTSSTSSTATAGTTVELLDAGTTNGGDEKMTGSSNGTRSRTDLNDHLMDSMNAASLQLDESEESASCFEEETNCILNYLSIMSREILVKENPDNKSLLNLIDVLSLLNSLLIEIPCSMIPAFDSRKGIQVLFQIIGNTIQSGHTDADDDASVREEKEVIRSLCLKILSSFLMRSTFKRKSLSMTSSHFSILYYILSRDKSILSHSLYVNLMEITIEAPISSLYSLQSSSSSGKKSNGTQGNKSDPDDDYFWSSSISASREEVGKEERASSSCSSAKENNGNESSGSGGNCSNTIKIENPHMIKVIAQLVVRNKQLADQFLKDLYTLLMDSRSNRRLILQMSVWQSWLIAFLRMNDEEFTEKEKRKRETTVVSLFKLLLYHALRWEFGGWRVWIDSLAIIHSFLSRESFNKMYSNLQDAAVDKSSRRVRIESHPQIMPTTTSTTTIAEEDEKPEDDRVSATGGTTRSDASTSRKRVTSSSTPGYRIPAFKWSSIHIQLLDSLLAAIIMDINSFRKEAMLRANLNASPTTIDARNEADTNESMILESLLMNSDIYVINVIHLISQLTDSTILDAGGLLPLLAQATSSGKASDKTNADPAAGKSGEGSQPATTDAASNNTNQQSDEDLMSESKASELLQQLVFCADYLIFNSVLSSGNTTPAQMATGNSVSLSELEQEKNMSSGGLLRQILRLVSIVSVKRVLAIKESEKRKSEKKEQHTDESKKTVVNKSSKTLTTSDKSDRGAGEEEEEEESDDEVRDLSTQSHNGKKQKFISRYTLIDREEESDQHLLSLRDIQRLRATIYRSDPMNEKDRANANFLSLSTMYFLSVLLVSKYRDTLDVVQTASGSRSRTSSTSSESEAKGSAVSGNKSAADLSQMEKSLYPTVQFLKELITDFEAFLSKSLLGSKGQVLLTKQLVKRIKSNECSPLELVMLLCAQEFQNSLQKNAGLAFIELINEGRLLCISMKEHVIRVGIEADFILTRIEREERERDSIFRRESFLIEDRREKECDLIHEVICNICAPQADAGTTGPNFTLSVPCSTSSFRSKLRGSKRKSFRDLEEFVAEKRVVLFKEDFLMQDAAAAAAAASVTRINSVDEFKSGSSNEPATQHLKHTTVNPNSIAACNASLPQTDPLVFRNRESNTAPTSSSSTSTTTEPDPRDEQLHRAEHEIQSLRERVQDLVNKISTLEKERDHAVLQLQSHLTLAEKRLLEDKSTDSIGLRETAEAGTQRSEVESVTFSEKTADNSHSPVTDAKDGTVSVSQEETESRESDVVVATEAGEQ